MAARVTGLNVAAYTLDTTDYLGDLQLFEFGVGASVVQTQGMAATNAFHQVASRSSTHSFELLVNNSGPKLVGLDVSAWDTGANLLGELRSGTLNLTIPTQDGAGVASVFDFPQVVGARVITIDATHLVPFTDPVVLRGLLADARSVTVSAWTKASVKLTLGTGVVFDLPMTLLEAAQSGRSGAIQEYTARFGSRGNPTAAPSGAGILGVAFSGDALLSVVADTGGGVWSGTGPITSLALSWDRGAVTRLTGTLALQGQPGYST